MAVCALLVATIAAAAAAYQTYVINEQFSATVWPYVSFDTSNDRTAGIFALGVHNVGLGPAIIRSAIVTIDGKRMGPGATGNPVETAFDGALRQAEAVEARRHIHGQVRFTTSSLAAGDVLPAGSSLTLMRAQGTDLYTGVKGVAPHFDLTLCYCSVLGRCWTRRLNDQIPEPHDVRSCSPNG